MMPNTTYIVKDENVVIWRNDNFIISIEEARAIAAKIRELMGEEDSAAIFVDNRKAGGAWPAEISEIWTGLMGDIYEEGLRCATVSPNFTNAMQINRLAKEAGMDDEIKAFKPDDYQEAVRFVRAVTS